MTTVEIVLKNEFIAEEVHYLSQQLYQFNAMHAGVQGNGITISLKNNKSETVGGLYGWTIASWLHVDILWVKEEIRGQGYGKKLLLAAEQEAVKRGCCYSELETYSFQAPSFYQKLGYAIFGAIDGVTNNHKWYFLKKNLLESSEKYENLY